MFNIFGKKNIIENEVEKTQPLKSLSTTLLESNSNNLVSKMKLLGNIMPIINQMEDLDNKKFNPLIKQLKDLLENYYINGRA